MQIMEKLMLTNEILMNVKKEITDSACTLMGTDLIEIILYGSCARGDYGEDSDIDIALLTKCGRMEVKKYDDGLDTIATEMAMKYFAIVNFICLPYEEFAEKKRWYTYFQNIDREGEVLYG